MLTRLGFGKRILLGVILCAVPGMLIALNNARLNYQLFLRELSQDAAFYAQQLARQQGKLIEEGHTFLKVLSEFPELQFPDTATCSLLARRQVSLFPVFSDISVPEVNGRLTCTSRRTLVKESTLSAPFINRAIQERHFTISRLIADDASGQLSIKLAYPVSHPGDNRIISVAVGTIPLQWWLNRLQDFHSDRSSLISFVTDASNQVVASYGSSGPRQGQLLLDSVWKNDGEDSPRQVNWSGVDYMVADSRMLADAAGEDSRLRFWVAFPLNPVYQEAYRQLWMDMGLLTLVAALTVFLLWVVVRLFVMKPLNSMLNRLNAKNLTTAEELDVSSLDEKVNSIIQHQQSAAEALSATEQQLVLAYHKQELILNAAPVGIIEFSDSMVILSWSDRCKEFFLCDAQAVCGKSIKSLQSVCGDRQFNDLAHLIEGIQNLSASTSTEIIITRSTRFENGATQTLYFQWRVSGFLSPSGESQYVATVENATKQQLQKKTLSERASIDWLTKLPNRYRIIEEIDKLIRNERVERFALVLFDLNGFKFINDTFGHDVGDHLLQSLSERMKASLGPGEQVARLGGDEFLLLLSNGQCNEDFYQAAERLTQIFFAPLQTDDRNYRVSASAGLSMYPDDGVHAQLLIKRADMAMYSAKNTRQRHWVKYESYMELAGRNRYEIETELRKAIEKGSFVVHYQPIVNSETLNVQSLEALIRWTSPRKGQVSPGVFIPVAEETGLINEIGSWVLEKTLSDLPDIRRRYGDNVTVSINLSPIQLLDNILADRLIKMAKEGDIVRSLVLEITENVFVDDESVDRIRQLRKAGYRIALDDFGTGYSSLSHIARMPIDILKIDQSFIGRLFDTERDTLLVKNIVIMAKDLNLSIVAEGVEQSRQLELLQQIGCDLLQGYHFSQPVPLAELA